MLESILAQDYPRIELIVSDDGTPDFDCAKVEADIRRRMDALQNAHIERLCVRKNEANMKTVRHVESVLPMATGEYVVFTAADDRFADSGVLSRYVRCFEAHPQHKWLVGKVAITSEDYKTTHHILPAEKDVPYFMADDAQRLFGRWSRRGMAIPCCMAFRPEAFVLAGGIDTSYSLMEDWPLVLHLLLAGYAPAYIDELTALHSVGGVTNSNNRYGVEIRRMFYMDKYRLLDTITEKNLHLLSPEDKRCYRLYQREIMDRNYFLNIDLPTKSKPALLAEGILHPRKGFWLLEIVFRRVEGRIRPRLLLVLAAILAAGALVSGFAGGNGFATAALSLGACGFAALAVFCAAYRRFLNRLDAARRELVN